MKEENNDIKIISEWGHNVCKSGSDKIKIMSETNDTSINEQYLKWYMRGAKHEKNTSDNETLNAKLRNKLQPLQTLLDILDALENGNIPKEKIKDVDNIMKDLRGKCRGIISFFID